MKKLKIFHKRPECIGCGLCVEVAPSYWHMDEDGLASLNTKIGFDFSYEIAHAWDSDMTILEKAQEGCPVQIIKIQK